MCRQKGETLCDTGYLYSPKAGPPEKFVVLASEFTDEELLTSDDNDYDVVIVGAGLSGLICAYDILKKETGLDVLIIETNRDAGGRILKDFSNSYYANSLQKHVTKLVELLNINIHKDGNSDDRKRILFAKSSPSEKLPRFFGADVHHFLQLRQELWMKDSEIILAMKSQDFLQNQVLKISYVKTFIPHTRAHCVAHTFVAHVGGMFKIIQELLKRIVQRGGKIKYQEPVKKIKFNDDRAYVQTEMNCFKCEFVVVALPPPNEEIVIESPPEYSLDTRNLYAPGENAFFKIIYKSSPWLSECSAKDIVTTWDTNSELNMAYNTTYRDTKTFVLSGLLAQSNPAQIHSKGLFDTLNLCFGTAEDQRYLQYNLWNPGLSHEQPMVVSSPMCFLKPTSLANHIHYAGVQNGRVFFASSENAANWPGTVDGCIEVGEITAFSILSRIRPQALTAQETFLITRKQSRTKKSTSAKMVVIQYLGIAFNIAIFLSFFKAANKHSLLLSINLSIVLKNIGQIFEMK